MSDDQRNPLPVASEALRSGRWRLLRDRFLSLFSRRMDEAGRHGFGDPHDERFLRALVALDGDLADGGRVLVLAALRDLGHAAGTHIYGVHVVEDDLDAAIRGLSQQVDETGLGPLREVERFHRTVHVQLQPSPQVQGGPRDAVDAYLAGLLEGSIARGFNVNVEVDARGDHAFHLELKRGPEGSQEVAHGR